LLSPIVHLTVRSSQSNDPKIKFQKQKFHELPIFFHLFSYIKKDERDREEKEERKKKQRRDGRNKNRNLTISTSNGHNF
jgi:hypothetical protein